ncbi:MAG: DUF484 family protein [Pseudomonadota bacterium]
MSSDTSPARSRRNDNKGTDSGPSAEEVARYLKAHPDFFIDRDSLLADLTLPHESGGAVSLLERQVKILRERGIDLRHKLNGLLETARYNDQLFNVTRHLILTLLDEDDPHQFISITEANLSTQPGIDACTLILTDDSILPDGAQYRHADLENMRQRFPSLFRRRHVVCQQVDEEVAVLLFPNHSQRIRSSALCPIRYNNQVIGILALGNHSRDYFNNDMDTLFLDFIADALGILLGRRAT